MWQIIDSGSCTIPVECTVHVLQFSDGCIYLVYVGGEYFGELEQIYSNQLPDTGNQCSDYGIQLEIPIPINQESVYYSRWV